MVLGFLAGLMWPAGITKARTLGGCSYQESSVFILPVVLQAAGFPKKVVGGMRLVRGQTLV